MKKPVVDQDLCIGCGECVDKWPEVFELRDDKAYVKGSDKFGTYDSQEMIDICPVQALSIVAG